MTERTGFFHRLGQVLALSGLLAGCAAPADLPPAPPAPQPTSPPAATLALATPIPHPTQTPSFTPTALPTRTPTPAPSSAVFLPEKRAVITAKNAGQLAPAQREVIAPDQGASALALDFSTTGYQFFVRYQQGGSSGDGYLRAYDLLSGAPLFALDPWAGSPPPGGIAFAADRVRFATWNTTEAAADVTIWDTIKGQKISTLHAASGRLGFSPDLETVAVAQKTSDPAIIAIHALSVRTQKELYKTSLTGWLKDCVVAFSPDGAYLAVARGYENSDGLVTILNAKTGREVKTVYNQLFSGFALDGKHFLGTAHQTTVRMFETATVKWTRDVPISASGDVSARYSPDAKLLLVQLPDRKIKIVDIETEQSVFSPKDPVDSAWLSKDGTVLATYTADPNKTEIVFWTVGAG